MVKLKTVVTTPLLDLAHSYWTMHRTEMSTDTASNIILVSDSFDSRIPTLINAFARIVPMRTNVEWFGSGILFEPVNK